MPEPALPDLTVRLILIVWYVIPYRIVIVASTTPGPRLVQIFFYDIPSYIWMCA